MEKIKVKGPVCPVCGLQPEIEVDETGYLHWLNGTVIQDAMPYLTIDQAEQLKTGLHGECWKTFLGPEK
jgi:hypothetical protein